MIRHINGNNGIRVNLSSGTPYINMSNPSAGMLRYNGSNQNFEVYDGSSWLTVSAGYADIELDYSVKEVIDWGRMRMEEEARWRHLAATSPTLADALEDLKRAEEKVKVVAALVETE